MHGAVEDHLVSNSQAESNPVNGEDSECLQLLRDLTYDPNLPEQELKQTSNEWLRNMKKRYKPCYYSSEEENVVESRCRAVAIPAAFIASGGLKSNYAEYKNTNPQKVQHVRLIKASRRGVLQITPLTASERNGAASLQGSVVKEQEKDSVAGTTTKEKSLSQTKESKTIASKQETESASSSIKVRKRTRKRGPKKKKDGCSMNGNSLECDN